MFKSVATVGCCSPKAASLIPSALRISGSASASRLVSCSSSARLFDAAATSSELGSAVASASAWRCCSSHSFQRASSLNTFPILRRCKIRASASSMLSSVSRRKVSRVSEKVRRVSPFPISASLWANASSSPLRCISQAATISSISER